MLEDLPPRHFGDLSIPVRADGTGIERTASGDDYWIYVRWLADHLCTSDVALHPRQVAWALDSDLREPSDGIFRISEWSSSELWDLESLEESFALGKSWESFTEERRRQWEEVWASSGEVDEHPIDEYLVSREVWNRILEEWKERPRFNHADIPYRALLARLLKRIPDPEERVRVLHFFFQNYTDNLSK